MAVGGFYCSSGSMQRRASMPWQLSLYLQVGEYLPARVHSACEHRAMTPRKAGTPLHTPSCRQRSTVLARGGAHACLLSHPTEPCCSMHVSFKLLTQAKRPDLRPWRIHANSPASCRAWARPHAATRLMSERQAGQRRPPARCLQACMAQRQPSEPRHIARPDTAPEAAV